MIQEVKMYTVVCDNCGISADHDSEYSCWTDEGIARDVAMDSNFHETKDYKHYCPNCYTTDDDDNFVIDESRKDLHRKQTSP